MWVFRVSLQVKAGAPRKRLHRLVARLRLEPGFDQAGTARVVEEPAKQTRTEPAALPAVRDDQRHLAPRLLRLDGVLTERDKFAAAVCDDETLRRIPGLEGAHHFARQFAQRREEALCARSQ